MMPRGIATGNYSIRPGEPAPSWRRGARWEASYKGGRAEQQALFAAGKESGPGFVNGGANSTKSDATWRPGEAPLS